MKKKTIALLLACSLAVGAAVGGTLAWLTAKTDEVVNTFTSSDINITLTETKPTGKTAKMIPGWTIEKDPKVTVEAGSEACYIFVKIEKSANYDTYLENYEVDPEWKQLKNGDTDVAGVYYQKLTAIPEAGWSDYILKGAAHKTDCAKDDSCTCTNLNGYVTVKDTVTKEQMNALTAQGATNPTLTFTAYATQLYKDNNTEFGAYEAWQKTAGYVPPVTP